VVFNLPAALDPAEYLKAVQVNQERIPDGSK
jgi:hypothetical protein